MIDTRVRPTLVTSAFRITNFLFNCFLCFSLFCHYKFSFK
ncbi:hypothetical protein vBEcoMWL3_gp203 [Escherichia phage vB_EcoM_WL-3]|nr:hypothetical protein vBEcoMWL3_gp203 [Escherichia phage vB_EcoM_WL-3]